MPHSTTQPSSAPTTLSVLQERAQRLQEQIRKEKAQGAIILGRWFQQRGETLGPTLALRMQSALEDTLKKPRDRRLFGLVPKDAGAAARPLKSEKLEAELVEVRAELDALRKREDDIGRALRAARRKEDDGRMFLQGDVVRRWREDDPAFAAELADDLVRYFKHPNDFAAVDMPVPANWRASSPELNASDGSAKEAQKQHEPEEQQAAAGRSEPAAASAVPRAAQEERSPQKSAPTQGTLPPPKSVDGGLPSTSLPKAASLPVPVAPLGRAASAEPRSAMAAKPHTAPVPGSSNGG